MAAAWQRDDWIRAAKVSESQNVFSWFAHCARICAGTNEWAADVLTTLAPQIDKARTLAKFSAQLSLELLHHFAERSIPMRVFKGQFLAQAAYGDACLRNSCDIDVIVPRFAVAAAAQCLRLNGFGTAVAEAWFTDAPFLDRFREVPFDGLGGFFSVDFHWRLANRWTAFPVEAEELFDQGTAVSMNVLGTAVPWFSPSLLWRIQLTHVVSSDWKGLKTWLDLAHTFDLLDDASTGDVLERCRALQCNFVLTVAALVLSDVFGRDTSKLISQQSPATIKRSKLVARLCSDLLLDNDNSAPSGLNLGRLWSAAAKPPKYRSLLARAMQHDLVDYYDHPPGPSSAVRAFRAVQRRIPRVAASNGARRSATGL